MDVSDEHKSPGEYSLMADEADRSAPFIEQMEKIALEHARQVKSYGKPRIMKNKRICIDCDEPLSQQRLKALPRAVLCVECQEEREREDRLYRR